MARYDRIARIAPPERDGCYPCWLTLRDLEGREREPELGRRARLRFLALRPVRRILRRGGDALDAESLRQQLESVRDELGVLPDGDAERARLLRYLEEVGGRSPLGLVTATLDVGAAAEVEGHPFAAEEFYETALELARSDGLKPQEMAALRQLGRVLRNRGEHERAIERLEEAAALAEKVGDDVQWARARDGIAAVAADRGDADEAREILAAIRDRGDAAGRGEVRAVADAGLCALELAAGNTDAALEAGWNAVTGFPADVEDRNGVLLNLATAFRRIGLLPAAESCYRIVRTRSTWPEHRFEAEAELAVVAAETGNVDAFRERRVEMLSRDLKDAHLAALVQLALGRGAVLIGDNDDARHHLRTAISTARDAGLDSILVRAEELLETLESGRPPAHGTGRPTAGSRRVAEQVQALGQELVNA